MIDICFDVLFMAWGFVGIFYPRILYKREALNQQQIERNNRIWKWGGAALFILGFLGLLAKIYWK
jgi:hypothetical protein